MSRHQRPRQSVLRPRRLAAPPLRFFLPLTVLVTLLALMVLRGMANNEVFHDDRIGVSVDKGTVPRSVLEGGPVVDTRGARTDDPVSYTIPDKTVVLSFDDGPSAQWTPKVLKVLAEQHVRADFFVTGSMATRNPALIREIVADGHEIGLHTFTHPDLALHNSTRLTWELGETQLALAGVAGIHTSLFRPPYSSTVDALDDWSWPVTKEVGSDGYLAAFIDKDTDDWKRPGVNAIVQAAMPDLAGQGEMILLHDAGGNRSQTLAALPMIIQKLKSEGYTFKTIGEALGTGSANTRVSGYTLWAGKAFVACTAFSVGLMPWLVVLLAVVGVLVFARFALMLVLSLVHVRRTRKPGFSWGEPITEPISVVVPAYNEQECITNTLLSLARSDHPVEVIVVDDGSTDGTATLVEDMDLPMVRLIRQPNSGKPTALNTGVAAASHDLIVMMDGDTVFEPATVRELVQPFADPRIGAVAGNAKVGNRDTLIGAWQHIEYVMGFNLDRRMYDVLDCMPTIPGAVGAFRRQALQQVGGMSDDTLAEDTDVTMALHRAGWKIVYAENARAWTEAPGSMSQLWSQRYRWSYGTMQAMWKHRHAVLERGPGGRFGRVGLPFVALFMVLTPLLAPAIDIAMVYGVFFVDPYKSLGAWFAVLALQAFCAWWSFRLDREKAWHLVTLPVQQVVYRVLMYMVLLQSWITALTGGRLRWQKLRRTGEVGLDVTTGAIPS
ncbi:bifunctional polysaccharide deacetylase/glycosyltransferase family 2 protein [Streptomyces sp. NBC_01799]|uniref:bifunctional polysaccharide deacetylase/glycosyltransferase family 2 protein n=1 Tax=Streptomyces sp. NBC_01800 TaxID=2975945 RepID=UPI002DD82C4C|nr:bifunctional polysaccharide deacetylase/glycosyltransferase family 2 protein [Streptomyces sp. NBC_01800]WSA72585.1 bifunctional polysaccharide deacetylase/glycosyltransferase family 2 protein [Streptomyces sp. NBC_01800]WSA81110.1 bifunctional polysaccharide deacetylase/glycosyltransferase family 2 protein [Streptomyces sp. NBC_01799]